MSVSKPISKITQLIKGNNFAEVSNLINSIAREDAKHVDELIDLGIFLAQNNKIELALVILQSLNDVVRHNIKIPYNIGLIYSFINEHEIAIKY